MAVTSPNMPASIRWGGIVALIQSTIGFGYAFFLIYREATGETDPSIVYETDNANTWVGYGTAAFFIIVFGTVVAGAINMMKGHRWGRGAVVMLNIILLPAAYYMFIEADSPGRSSQESQLSSFWAHCLISAPSFGLTTRSSLEQRSQSHAFRRSPAYNAERNFTVVARTVHRNGALHLSGVPISYRDALSGGVEETSVQRNAGS